MNPESEYMKKVGIRCAECGKVKPYYTSELWRIVDRSNERYCSKECAEKALRRETDDRKNNN